MDKSARIGGFLVGALLAMLASFALGQVQVSTTGIINSYSTFSTLTAGMPASSVPVGTLAFATTEKVLYYSDGTSWNLIYPRYPATSASVGGALLALGGCTADAAVSIPSTATTFEYTSTVSIGGSFTIDKWITTGVAHLRICAPVIGGTPPVTTFLVKAFP